MMNKWRPTFTSYFKQQLSTSGANGLEAIYWHTFLPFCIATTSTVRRNLNTAGQYTYIVCFILLKVFVPSYNDDCFVSMKIETRRSDAPIPRQTFGETWIIEWEINTVFRPLSRTAFEFVHRMINFGNSICKYVILFKLTCNFIQLIETNNECEIY